MLSCNIFNDSEKMSSFPLSLYWNPRLEMKQSCLSNSREITKGQIYYLVDLLVCRLLKYVLLLTKAEKFSFQKLDIAIRLLQHIQLKMHLYESNRTEYVVIVMKFLPMDHKYVKCFFGKSIYIHHKKTSV